MAAVGFKVADAYVAIHADDDTAAGRDRIRRNTDDWAKKTGDSAGDNMARSMFTKLGTGLKVLFSTLARFALISSIVGVIGTAVSALAGYIVQLMGVLNTLGSVIIQAAGALLLLPGAFAVVLGSLLTIKLAFGGIGAALKAGMEQAGGAVQQQTDKIIKAFEKLTGTILGWRSSQRQVEADFDALQQALVASAGSLDITNAKGRAAAGAVDDIVKAAQQAAQAKYNETGSIQQANQVYDQYIQRLRGTLETYGVAQTSINDLLGSVSQFPTTFEAAAGSASQLDQAMQKLSKNAQELVRTLIGMKSVWMGIQFALQDALFAGVAAQLKSIAGNLVPTLTTGFTTLGTALHGVLEQLLAFLGATQTQSQLGGFFSGIAGVLDNISRALQPLLTVAFTIINASLVALRALTGGLADKAIGWVDKLGTMVDSGRFQELIDNGVAALKVLGAWFVDVFGIIKGVFGAAGKGDFFGWFDRLNKLVNSVPVQNTLVMVFQALRQAADAFTPALSQLIIQVGRIIMGFATLVPVVAPILDVLFKGLGQAIVALMPSLGRVLDTVGQVAVLLVGPLQAAIEILAQLVVAIGPSVSQILRGLGPVMDSLAAAAPAVGKALGDILGAIAKVLPVLGPVLGDVLVALANALSQIAVAVGPSLPLIFKALGDALVQLLPLLPALMPLIPILVQATVDVLTQLGPQLPGLVKSIVDLAIAVTPLVILLLKLYVIFQDIFVRFQLKPLVEGLTWVFNALVVVINWLVDAWRTLGDWLPKVGHWFEDLWTSIKNFFKAFWDKVTGFWGWITGLPGQILDNVKDFGTLLYNKGRDLIGGLIEGIKSKAADLVRTIKEGVTDLIPQWIKDKLKIGSPSKVMMGLGEDTMEGYTIGLQNKKPDLAKLLGTFTPPPGGGVAPLMPAGMGSTTFQMGSTFVKVQIGEKTVSDMVVTTMRQEPVAVAKAADEGNRQQAFLNPGRKRVGDR